MFLLLNMTILWCHSNVHVVTKPFDTLVFHVRVVTKNDVCVYCTVAPSSFYKSDRTLSTTAAVASCENTRSVTSDTSHIKITEWTYITWIVRTVGNDYGDGNWFLQIKIWTMVYFLYCSNLLIRTTIMKELQVSNKHTPRGGASLYQLIVIRCQSYLKSLGLTTGLETHSRPIAFRFLHVSYLSAAHVLYCSQRA